MPRNGPPQQKGQHLRRWLRRPQTTGCLPPSTLRQQRSESMPKAEVPPVVRYDAGRAHTGRGGVARAETIPDVQATPGQERSVGGGRRLSVVFGLRSALPMRGGKPAGPKLQLLPGCRAWLAPLAGGDDSAACEPCQPPMLVGWGRAVQTIGMAAPSTGSRPPGRGQERTAGGIPTGLILQGHSWANEVSVRVRCVVPAGARKRKGTPDE